jgi:hypothetical protein
LRLGGFSLKLLDGLVNGGDVSGESHGSREERKDGCVKGSGRQSRHRCAAFGVFPRHRRSQSRQGDSLTGGSTGRAVYPPPPPVPVPVPAAGAGPPAPPR